MRKIRTSSGRRIKSRKTYGGHKWSNKYSRRSYKTDENWLKALYKKNKEDINNSLSDAGVDASFRQFKQLVVERMETTGKKLEEAVDILGKTRDFTSVEEMGIYNIQNKMSSADRALLKDELGYRRNQKINFDYFKWDSSQQMYIWTGPQGQSDVGIVFNKDYKKQGSLFKIITMPTNNREKAKGKAIRDKRDAGPNVDNISFDELYDDLPF